MNDIITYIKNIVNRYFISQILLISYNYKATIKKKALLNKRAFREFTNFF